MENIIKGKRIYSAIAPSGDGTLHIGNYLGAVKQFIELAKTNECFLQIANIHALTTVQNREQLVKNVETLVLNELALLGDLKNISFCLQSDISYHTELQSILNNFTPLGLIKRAHAYKDKLQKETAEDDINCGLFNYPILMAADILIYKTTLVPVGKDQKQHVEIARDIAQRFNKIYQKKVFSVPDVYIPENTAVVLGTDGKRKMSKSLGNIISIFEPEEIIHKQVMSTYTDPTRLHADDPGHIEGNMVFTYLDFFAPKEEVDILKDKYQAGKVADIEVKEYLFKVLMKYFAPARARYAELKAKPEKVKQILEKGAEKARLVASQTMQEVRETIGLVNRYSINMLDGARKIQPASIQRGEGVSLTEKITIDEFARVEMRVGLVEQAENVEKSEKLIRLHVNFGPDFAKATTGETKRIIFTGVRTYGYIPDDFIGKKFMFVVNLEYRKMLGEESQGMIMAVNSVDGKPIFLSVEGLPLGSKIR